MANETQQTPAIEAVAIAKHVRMSPQKIRLVVDMIRGQRAEDALQILRFTKKRASRDVEKVLRSAIANAERKAEDAGASLDVDHLFVSNCFVNEGSRWKRLRPGADGPRLPLSAAHRAHRRRRGRASCGRARARGGRRGRSGIAEGRCGRGEEGSAGAGREEKAGGSQVVRRSSGGNDFGTEDTSIRISAGLQQAVEVALVRRPRLRRPAARRRASCGPR